MIWKLCKNLAETEKDDFRKRNAEITVQDILKSKKIPPQNSYKNIQNLKVYMWKWILYSQKRSDLIDFYHILSKW